MQEHWHDWCGETVDTILNRHSHYYITSRRPSTFSKQPYGQFVFITCSRNSSTFSLSSSFVILLSASVISSSRCSTIGAAFLCLPSYTFLSVCTSPRSSCSIIRMWDGERGGDGRWWLSSATESCISAVPVTLGSIDFRRLCSSHFSVNVCRRNVVLDWTSLMMKTTFYSYANDNLYCIWGKANGPIFQTLSMRILRDQCL